MTYVNRVGRMAVVTGTAAAIALGAVGLAEAAPTAPTAAPTAANDQLKTVFTPKHQGYSTPKAKRKAGVLHAQVDLRGKHPKYYPMAWSFKVTNKKLKAIARGPMSCKASGLNGKYHDKHYPIPVGYQWHSTVGSKKHPHKKKKVYNLSGTCVFKVQVGHKPGKATVGFHFKYAINPYKKKAAVRSGVSAPVTTTKVALND
ncbi:hypothetical protein [Streptomyces sp. NPDC059009]|uniref:hypothetical protein n=1 Tax=Streptomyces sp. NPDC059009 TaxID=3346694 RepID=UPI0036C8D7E5